MNGSENTARILVIEDELAMRTVLEDTLTAKGFRVFSAADGETGLRRAVEEKPDLIVLDIMMPRLDGFALCAELRRLSNPVPVLMLTAKGQIRDRVRGLEAGADDYLVKPFSTEELVARIRALLRRMQHLAKAVTTITLGDVQIDFLRQQAWRNKQPLYLTSTEFHMLRLLAEADGEPVSRDQFLDVVWGYAVFPTTRTVDVHVAHLRAKIEPDPKEPRFLKTVHEVGYRLKLHPDR